ncbi:Sema domain-containing protein [Aphelenchoides fujianensis]|nr:Sema domain-containing protein [Aphelenchoides fujianensis]
MMPPLDTGPSTSRAAHEANDEDGELDDRSSVDCRLSSPPSSTAAKSPADHEDGRARHRTRWRRRASPKEAARIESKLPLFSSTCRLLTIFLVALVGIPSIAAKTPANNGGFKPDSSVLATFSETFEGKEVELEKMIVDPLTNRLYVGAVNHLFDISPVDLSVREHAVTGPRLDSILCADALRGCSQPLVQTNSYTKALAIDEDSNKLIECTSLYQGRCRTRNLSNIQRETDVHTSRPGIVPNDQKSSTVIFVGRGPSAANSNSPIVLSSFGADRAATTGTQPRVLYVGSTYVPVSQGPRDALDVPAVSSLLLDSARLFEFTSQTISSGTVMKLDYLNRPLFPIDYIGGFEANGFAYFATRQPKYTGEGQPVISKLVRVCTQDSNFYSYTETPLECMRNGVHYNLLQDIHIGNPGFDLANSLEIKTTDQVLFGVFTRGEGPERNVTSRDSALCVFRLKDIEEKFFENIRECYNGNTRTNLPWFNSDKKCTSTRYPDSEITCGKDVNSFIGGEIPIVAHAILTEQGAHFSSVVVTSVQSATVAFIGTSNGQILKALLEASPNQTSRIFKTIALTDGTPLLQDMELDEKNGLLYAMSRSAVYKVNYRQCATAVDCRSCLEVGDPFCGWCQRQSQCVTEESCIGGEIRDANNQRIGTIIAKNDWFNYKSGRCPIIQAVEPTEQQITTSKNLNVRMENLPSSLEGFSCAFVFPNQQTFKASAVVNAHGVSCPTPTRTDLRNLGADGAGAPKSVVARLTILKAYDGSPLASSNFTFFDCNQLSSCTECASSRFPCDWCALSARCVPNAEDVCAGEMLVNSISRKGPSSRRGPDFCPRFTPVQPHPTELFIASGHKRQLSFRAHNLHDAMKHFKCAYSVDHATHERPATRVGDRIHCDEMRFEFFSRGFGNGTARAEFSVVWWPDSSMMQKPASGEGGVGNLIAAALSAGRPEDEPEEAKRVAGTRVTVGPGHRLDNTDDFHVLIYKCEQLAPNCGLCLGLETAQFECGWCAADSRCTHADSCAVATAPEAWLSRAARPSGGPPTICPFPRIDGFMPRKGPINGGTKITITGSNLGLSPSDLRNAVHVANVPCDTEYVSSTRVVCNSRAPSVLKRQTQHVVIKLRDDPRYTAVSNDTYTFVNPKIASFRPYRGPRSGGTDLTILGEDLDSGHFFNVTVGSVKCSVLQRSSSMVVCRTGPSAVEGADFLIVNADGTQIKADSVQFQYTANPVIERVARPVSIVSGGITLDVFGKGLDLLQRPKMLVTYEDAVYVGPVCEVLDEHLMTCKTPGLEDLPLHRRAALTVDRPLLADFGFDLDGSLTGNLTIDRPLPRLAVYDDPRLVPFGEVLTIRPAGDLVVKGASLNVAATSRDVRVTVGGQPCNVTALSPSTLTCQLAAELPEEDLEVLVFVGDRAERVGFVSSVVRSGPSTNWLIVAFVIAFIGIFLALTLFILYRRKNSSHNRQLRYLRNQMSSIEMKVAQECKSAFCELQTSMNALAHGVPQGASFIPMLDYRDYTARILFPNHSHATHPVLNELAVEAERAEAVESGLRQLNRLLLNSNFLLAFVRTIDDNKYLLLKDRVYVGSLLMVILQSHMEYCTEILKQLLKELIRRNLDGKFQPKILFRRAESVAERMLSAWFSFLMYRFLDQAAGKELYQLYLAIKQQTEKGPQDAITMDARYSLSEEKLLRASLEFQELTIFVLNDGQPGSSLYDTQVRVLDCDSISQVKEKCLDAKYRTTPFSQRPSPSDVDLELRTPTHRVLLQDLDATSRADNGVWRYNTLAHYKIENKATFALVPKPASGSVYNLSMLSDRSEKSSPMGSSVLHHHPSHAHLHHQTSTNSPTMNRAPFNTVSSHHSHGISKDGGPQSTLRVFHLVRPSDHGPQEHQEDKLVAEVYLTRLLTMKGTLKHFIKRVLKVILSANTAAAPLPLCIKYMFDFLDEQAMEHGIDEPEVVHAWKSNALPLRFWVNLLKNPDFIFDIQKPTKIEGSLNVVAQTLMDSCSTQDQHLTKDSPSSKLLFADVIGEYKQWIADYYKTIREMPPVRDEQMSAMLAEESRTHANDFRVFSALNELFVYVQQNKEAISEELSQNDVAINQQLPEKFVKLLDTMEVVPDGAHSGNSMDGYNSKSRLMSNSTNRFY